jgi:hypothetical protein
MTERLHALPNPEMQASEKLRERVLRHFSLVMQPFHPDSLEVLSGQMEAAQLDVVEAAAELAQLRPQRDKTPPFVARSLALHEYEMLADTQPQAAIIYDSQRLMDQSGYAVLYRRMQDRRYRPHHGMPAAVSEQAA